MEERAGSFGSLPRSAAHRIVSKQSVPRDLNQLQAFLRACDLPESRWKPWESAWSRAWRVEKQEHGVWFDGNWPAELGEGIQPRRLRPLVPGPRAAQAGVVVEVDLRQYEDPLAGSSCQCEPGGPIPSRCASFGVFQLAVTSAEGRWSLSCSTCRNARRNPSRRPSCSSPASGCSRHCFSDHVRSQITRAASVTVPR